MENGPRKGAVDECSTGEQGWSHGTPLPHSSKDEVRLGPRADRMARVKAEQQVVHVRGPVVLDFGNGIRFQLTPMGGPTHSPIAPAKAKGAGRPPSPATLALRQAMMDDAKGAGPRSRGEYLVLLKGAGWSASPNAAGIILNREAKRAFGHPLGRDKKGARKGAPRRGRKGGRQPSPATLALRAKLAEDAAKGALRDAPHYLRWVVDQPGVKLGLKGARPIVYRELRAVRST